MKQQTKMLFITISFMIIFTGCVGMAISPLRGLSSISVAEQLNVKEPLKASKQEAISISVLALGYPSTRVSVFKKRFKELQLRTIFTELESSKRFRLVHFTEFKKVEPLILSPTFFWDPFTDKQKKEITKKIGKKLDANAILLVKEKSRKTGKVGMFAQATFVGTINMPTVLSFEVVSSTNGQTIWRQEQELVYTAGQAFINQMSDEEVIEMIKPTTRRLINNLVDSFGPAVSRPPVTYLITIKNSNIRSEPSIKAITITNVKKGTKLENIGKSGNWFNVNLPSGKTGYIYKSLVKQAE
jgi:hypothetical protein